MNALGHNHLPRVVPPTYTKRGYIEHKCSRCDDFWNDTYTDPLGLPKPAVKAGNNPATGGGSLTWADDGEADYYEIYRATSKKGKYKLHKTVEEAEANVSVGIGKTYYYKVKAICEDNPTLTSSYSNVVKVTGKCAQPDVTVTVKESTGKPVVKWGKVSSAKKYYVYRSTSASKSYKAVATTTDTEYTATSAGVGKAYYYKVIAIGENCKSAYSSYKKLTAKCAQPVITVEVKESTGKPVIKWSKISGARTYNVYRVDEATGTRTSLGSTSKTSFTDSKAEVGMTYSYQVRANGSKSSYNSDYSEIRSCLTICGQPDVTLKNDAATGKPVLSWKAISGAATYEIYRSENDGTFELIATQAELTYTDENAVVDGVYSYKVNAIAEDAVLNCVDNSPVTITAACAKPAASIVLDGKKPMVSWEPVEGAARYYVYRSTKKSSDFKKVATVEDGESYTDSKAKKGTTYYYKVVAVGETTSGAYSNVLKIKSK